MVLVTVSTALLLILTHHVIMTIYLQYIFLNNCNIDISNQSSTRIHIFIVCSYFIILLG
jgi:hypothetical protein